MGIFNRKNVPVFAIGFIFGVAFLIFSLSDLIDFGKYTEVIFNYFLFPLPIVIDKIILWLYSLVDPLIYARSNKYPPFLAWWETAIAFLMAGIQYGLIFLAISKLKGYLKQRFDKKM